MTIPAFQRFLESMNIGYVEWHDGIGYDLEAFVQLSPDERIAAEGILVSHCDRDWRDIEALDYLGSERALAAMASVLKSKNFSVRIAAATRLAKRKLLSEAQVEAVLLDTLPSATLINGLTDTLRLAGAYPTPAVRRKLLWCTLHGNDAIRVHAAARIHFLYGVAASSFDWEFRPLYLRFGSSRLAERRQAYLELCASIHVDPKWALDSGDEN